MPLAQGIEQQPSKLLVIGSNPIWHTIKKQFNIIKMYHNKYQNDVDLTIKASRLRKPRAKQLNENLPSQPTGKMFNPKDIGRSKQKHNLRHQLDFNED